MGCYLWGHTELDTTDAIKQQQQPERMKSLGQNDAQSVEVSDGESKIQCCKNRVA